MIVYGDPIRVFCSQNYININACDVAPLTEVDVHTTDKWIADNCAITKTVFDYYPDSQYPPCVNFLGRPLEDKVFVLSFDPTAESIFPSSDPIQFALEQKLNEDSGVPKTPLEQLELAWVGVEVADDYVIINNNQISGCFFSYLSRHRITWIHRMLIDFVEKEYPGKTVYIPHHSMLEKYVQRMSAHPNRAIKRSPYSSKVVHGYELQVNPIQTKANELLADFDCVWWAKPSI
jgi:hypothetical protein